MCRSISFRLCLLVFVVLHVGPVSQVEGTSSVVKSGLDETPVFETVRTSNAALFNRLGLSPLRISPGHHKKRLAGPEPPVNFRSQDHQSYGRRHGHRDSHVYIVKLPPSPPYYAITRPHKETSGDVKGLKNKGPSFPVGFQSNGKPGGIYHWNLPLMKKMAEKKKVIENRVEQQNKQKILQANSNEIRKSEYLNPGSKIEEKIRDLRPSNLVAFGTGISDFPPVDKHARNNDKRLSYPSKESRFDGRKESKGSNGAKKNYRLEDSVLYNIKPTHDNENRLTLNSLNDPLQDTMYGTSQRQKKHRKKSAMSYYAPFSLKSGSTSMKNKFSGNGKPKAFYVIEKNRKPVYYHPLLP